MFEVENLSHQQLVLSDGMMLAPVGKSSSVRKLEKITEQDLKFRERGWISIRDLSEQKQQFVPPMVEKTEKKSLMKEKK